VTLENRDKRGSSKGVERQMDDLREKIEEIKQYGYCRLSQVFSLAQTQRLLGLCIEWHQKTKDRLPAEAHYLSQNQPYSVYNLQNKDFHFLETLFASAEVEFILKHFLNDKWYKPIPHDQPNYILRSYCARSSTAALPLHLDSFVPYLGEYTIAMQYVIVLEDQSPANGCTLVVPGSHQCGEYAAQDRLKDAVPIESRAGDVVLWDTRLWHATAANTTSGSRWAILATFTRWWIKQFFNITQNFPQEFYDRLTAEQKAVLGFCSIPYNNEFEGIDFKKGYEGLPASMGERIGGPFEPGDRPINRAVGTL
jgi:ectoine hydroxylase-related dioxygenase (phytanoyl-CoA dioxygenase family)